MKFTVVLDLGEDTPVLLGPFHSESGANAIGTGFVARWGGSFDVLPMYATIGEYIRLTEGADQG